MAVSLVVYQGPLLAWALAANCCHSNAAVESSDALLRAPNQVVFANASKFSHGYNKTNMAYLMRDLKDIGRGASQWVTDTWSNSTDASKNILKHAAAASMLGALGLKDGGVISSNSASFGTPGTKYGLMPIRDFQVPPRTFSLQAATPGRLAQVV